MKKKIIVPAIVSIFFLVVVLLIRSNKKQSSVTVPEITLVYAENQVEDYPTSKGANEFARLVNEKTNGRIKIVVKCNGELGDEKSIIEQLKFGGIDFSRESAITDLKSPDFLADALVCAVPDTLLVLPVPTTAGLTICIPPFL